MDLHKAIRAIHSTVVVIDGDTQKTIVATDKDNKEVTIDWTKVNGNLLEYFIEAPMETI